MAIKIGTGVGETLTGTLGNDVLIGLGGNDILQGLAGNDTYQFSGSFGNDVVSEGTAAGTDTLRLMSDIPASSVRLVGTVYDDLYVVADGYGSIKLTDHLLAPKVEFLQLGSATPISLTGGLTMTGAAGNDSLYGTLYNDTLNGKAGNDFLAGRGGNDTYQFSGAFGNDVVSEGSAAGTDTLRLMSDIPASSVRLVGTVYDDLYVVADGYGSIKLTDHLLAPKVEFLQLGSAAPISLTGGLTMTGSAGNDSLYGTRHGDTLIGGAGSDYLLGGAGNDRLIGGSGRDSLTGGEGADKFVFKSMLGTSNADTIRDFALAEDKIVLGRSVFTTLPTGTSTLDASRFFAGAGATSAADASDRVVLNTSTGSLYFDADGVGGAASVLFAQLSVPVALTASHFLIES